MYSLNSGIKGTENNISVVEIKDRQKKGYVILFLNTDYRLSKIKNKSFNKF